MNLFQLLRRDHEEIDSLLTRLQRPPGQAGFDEEGRRYLLDRLVMVASRHEAAEELVLWPSVRRRLDGGAELADQALQSENDAKAVLDAVPTISPEPELAAWCGELHSLLRAHARFEEDVVFPELGRRTTRIWATVAGDKFRIARRGGPTRPHSKGPDRPLGLLTRGAPAVMTDHIRDLGHRSRRHPVGFEEPEQPDAISMIMDDHERIGKLLTRIEGQEAPDDESVFALIREISIHDAIERQHLYPAIRVRILDGNDTYRHLIGDHGRLGELITKIGNYRFHDEARKRWLYDLAVDARTHMEHEEGSVLPALRARMTQEELIDLGAALQKARGKAPTRPHTLLAGAGTGARILRFATTPVDKARDVLAGRRGG